MKTTLLILLASITVSTAQPPAFRERLRRHFDADKDGALSESEKAAAREAVKNRAGNLRAKADANGDGTLDETERNKAREQFRGKAGALRQRLLQHFDEDKDGQLSEAERAKARAAISQRRSR
jgi:EF hand